MRPIFWASAMELLAFSVSNSGHSAEGTPKSAYHLFNPTPKEQMREFATDRPDRTESPITVDAGHFQIETDFVNLTKNGESKSWIFNFMNLKAGLTNDSDLQVLIENWVRDGGNSGVGKTIIRYKYNFFGNDGGPVAMGLMPYVTLPTQSSSLGESRSEGGLILPVGFDTPNDFGIGMMFQYDRARNVDNNGFHSRLISTITASHDLFLGLEGYLEFFSQAEQGAEWVATVDAGIVLPVGEHFRFDFGANVGVTESADDLNPFIGLSARY